MFASYVVVINNVERPWKVAPIILYLSWEPAESLSVAHACCRACVLSSVQSDRLCSCHSADRRTPTSFADHPQSFVATINGPGVDIPGTH